MMMKLGIRRLDATSSHLVTKDGIEMQTNLLKKQGGGNQFHEMGHAASSNSRQFMSQTAHGESFSNSAIKGCIFRKTGFNHVVYCCLCDIATGFLSKLNKCEHKIKEWVYSAI
jgi:hypothetical protein